MRLTTHSDYALRVLIYVASFPGRHVSTREISQAYKISLNHLAKIVNELGQAGYLDIKRGRNGGVALGRPPEGILLGDLLRVTEPDFHMAECFDPANNKCPILPVCGLPRYLKEASDAFIQALNRHTLADVMGAPGQRDYASLLARGGDAPDSPDAPDTPDGSESE